MTKDIWFNETSSAWTNDRKLNTNFLMKQLNDLQDMMECRGYVYLNQIYEYLGITWNPDEENICYRDSIIITLGFRTKNKDEILISVDQF